MIAGVAVNFSVAEAKRHFLDRDLVVARVERGKLKVLSRFGAYTRRDARSSLRRRKRPTKPGQPPAVHVGLVKQLLFFVYDPQRESVVVGPARINKPEPDTLALLEHGGKAQRRVRLLHRGRDGKLHPVRKGQRLGRKKNVVVRTARSGPKQTVTYAPHPFMRPAFHKNLPKVPGMWRDVVK